MKGRETERRGGGKKRTKEGGAGRNKKVEGSTVDSQLRQQNSNERSRGGERGYFRGKKIRESCRAEPMVS